MSASLSTPMAGAARSRGDWRAGWRERKWVLALLFASLVGVAALLLWSPWHRPSPLLATPALALQQLQAKSLYFNGPAWSWLVAQRPDLLKPQDRLANSEALRNFTQAVQNPKLFRQLDRQERFDKLLLVGDPSQYRPLLDHLLETRDWSLAYVDHLSVVFQRGSAAQWEPAQVEAVLARLGSPSARERAVFLAQVAGKLVAVHEPAAARALLERARALDAKTPEVWSTQAHYFLERGEWKDCEAAANQALALDPGNLSATGAKAQALYSTKRFNEAYALSQQLVERLPDDPGMLFYHAKIAHSARAFEDETRVLRKLILLAEANDRPTAGYRVYLGQALATSGEAEPAIAEFRKAMADPELPQDQRTFARECIATVRSQVKK